jgi:starch synthase (maltosyl-transferring)
MTPAPGERLLRFAGDRVRFCLRDTGGAALPEGWSAKLRTNLGRAEVIRREIIEAHTKGLALAGASWRDLPMRRSGGEWFIELPLAEAGYFKAKAYAIDPQGWQHWPDGPDSDIAVLPDICRTANTIYCAFPRMFGPNKTARSTQNESLETQLKELDRQGFTVIPPSGKLRDLISQLPHITRTLGCRVLHLLPVNPTPTTYARFGRFGSLYASLDLSAVDPALVEFDKRTSGVEQFCELAYATHLHGARLFLDIAINHTGWGAVLQENHPEWFVREHNGDFASPGAWGTTWEDLVELKHDNVALWDELAEIFLTWCRRGVDGFRCDAGYKIPVPAWQYVTARVHQEFPATIFLLEGLGGAWETTEALLTEGGMQSAYSELFQNYSGRDVAGYLDFSLRQSGRVGLLVHYSETHDNNRLAAKSPAWSLLRNRLSALASVSGGFGFTCGVEWLASEKINVHSARGMAWGSTDNLIPELATLNQLLAGHPCFFDGAKLTRLSLPDSPVYALYRVSAEGADSVLVLVNNDVDREQTLQLDAKVVGEISELKFELLGQPLPGISAGKNQITFTLAAGACHCLAPTAKPVGLSGDAYRRARAQAAWGLAALNQVVPAENVDGFDWRRLAEQVDRSPTCFLAAAGMLEGKDVADKLTALLARCERAEIFSRVVVWNLMDCRRVTPVPPGHWLLIQDSAPFRATLEMQTAKRDVRHVESIAVRDGHVACFPPMLVAGDAVITLERYAVVSQHVAGALRFLSAEPGEAKSESRNLKSENLVLLTNGRGGMARICVDLGRVLSKYDCVLGANLNPAVPVDRHVFVKRIRAWVNADGFITALDAKNLAAFKPGPPAVWHFIANAGDGRTVEIELSAAMLEGRNTTTFRFSRPATGQAAGKQLPADADVRLTVRLDIEDRNFHGETKRNGGAEHHFATHTRTLADKIGFTFTPAPDRQFRATADAGGYHPQPEWCENIPHPVEQSRGQVGSGDAYSPGWFDLPLAEGAGVNLVLTAEPGDEVAVDAMPAAAFPGEDDFAARLHRAVRAFVVRRDEGKTVIAGYPWFLDWGRDSLICARGLLAAGMVDEVRQLLLTFARFEERGTLPNAIHGGDASNRDTSDAPLWFGVACEEIAGALGRAFYETKIGRGATTVADVLQSIAAHYAGGAPNGIRMDADSALIWNPAHFTWMDTNHPAGTPREGFPVEIQALWIRLLRQLERIGARTGQFNWNELADRAQASLEKYFWLKEQGWFADLLIARPGESAANAVVDDALRGNFLIGVSLGVLNGERARRAVEAARRYLVVPGALRTLAPLRQRVPLPIRNHAGQLLNNPLEPYWGRYEGDEDTRRKPAYHNGTAWTWQFPVFCEALACAWEFSPPAVAAARAYLGGMERLLNEGCIGQLPEILDGDAPHTQRGCDAQAWGATEALRVWKKLECPTE